MGEMRKICMIQSLFMEFSADGQQSESIEAKVDEFCSELCEICVIHCKFKSKKKFGIFTCSFRRRGIEKCVWPVVFCLANGLGLFAMRLPSLSWRMEIFLPMFPQVLFFFFFFFLFTNSSLKKKKCVQRRYI